MSDYEKKEREALELAGKLSTAAHLVTTSDLSQLSDRLIALNKARVEYDNFIFRWTMEEK